MNTSSSSLQPLRPPQTAPLPLSFTDCPQCREESPGTTILPCGHLICRRCLDQLLRARGPPFTCRTCGQRLHVQVEDYDGDVDRLIRDFGEDPVVKRLALRRLWQEEVRKGDVACDTGHLSRSRHRLGRSGETCPEGVEVVTNQDLHRKAFSDSPSNENSTVIADGNGTVEHSKIVPDSSVASTGRQNYVLVDKDLQRNESHSNSRPLQTETHHTEDLDSQPRNDGAHNSQYWARWVEEETQKLDQAYAEQERQGSTLTEILRLAHEALEGCRTQKWVLNTYSQTLQHSLVYRELRERHAYLIREEDDDVLVTVKTASLEQRLCDVRKNEGVVAAMEGLLFRLRELVQGYTHTAGNPDALDGDSSQPVPKQPTHLSQSSTASTGLLTPSFHIQAPFAHNEATSAHSETPIPCRETPSMCNTGTPSSITTSPTLRSPSPVTLRSSRRRSRHASSSPSPSSPAPPLLPSPPPEPQAVPVFMLTPTSSSDRKPPAVTAIISTRDGPLVLADAENRNVKVVQPEDPFASPYPAVKLEQAPFGLAELEKERLVAVTTGTRHLYLLTLCADHQPSVESRLKTERKYTGVTGHPDGYLIVGCRRSDSSSARVDVVTRWGHVVRTIADSVTVTGLDCVGYLSLLDRHHLLVSDLGNHTVLQVELACGQVSETLVHAHLCYPRQVCAHQGSVYVASMEGQCVLVKRAGSSDGQRWCRFAYGPDHSVSDYVYPWGVCVTRAGLVVVAWRKGLDSVVVAYRF